MRSSFYLFCILLLSCFGIECRGDGLKSRVEPVFELSSIAFRVAGAEEYQLGAIPSYDRDIDRHFTVYKDHPLIAYIDEIRIEYGIGYDAVMQAAALLEIKDGKIELKDGFSFDDIEKVDIRWTPEAYEKYAEYLDRFYRDTGFEGFYAAHERLYRKCEAALDEVLATVNTSWYESFFGQALVDPTVIASAANGHCNYALSTREGFLGPGIVIGMTSDRKGRPDANEYRLQRLVVHELCHAFSNNIVSEAWNDEMEADAKTIYGHVGDKMEANGYGAPYIMITEWFNNLCTIMYFKENPDKDHPVGRESGRDQRKGFVWMDESCRMMEGFYADRSAYPSVADYFPVLASFIHSVAADFDKYMEAHEQSYPHVTDVFPEYDGNKCRIVFVFSDNMFTHAYGIGVVKNEDGSLLPLYTKNEHWRDSVTFVAEIKGYRKLEPGGKYGVRLHRHFFLSDKNGYPLKEDYVYVYECGKR